MDLSPIQRVTAAANAALRTPPISRAESPRPVAQAAPVSADQQVESRSTAADRTRVTVEWHAASVGYVTRVVDQHTGSVVHQSPPEQVLNMVQRIIARLKELTA